MFFEFFIYCIFLVEKPEIKHSDNIDLEKRARCGSADFPETGTHAYLKKQKKVMFLDSGLTVVIPKEEEKEFDEEGDVS